MKFQIVLVYLSFRNKSQIFSNLAIVCIRKADSRKIDGRKFVSFPPPPPNISGLCLPYIVSSVRLEGENFLTCQRPL